MPKSNASTAAGKAKKQHPDWEPPYEDFPLSYHPPSGRLYKTVHRKRIYFGYARNWKEALAEWLRTKDEHLAGRKPRPKNNGKFSVGMLCNRFLTAQHHKLQTGEISPRHFGDCRTTTDRIVKAFGAARAVEDLDELVKQCRKGSDNPISKEMRKLLNAIGIKRRGVSFYSLRHVFETIGGEARDQVAVSHIMGHADDSMSAVYREAVFF